MAARLERVLGSGILSSFPDVVDVRIMWVGGSAVQSKSKQPWHLALADGMSSKHNMGFLALRPTGRTVDLEKPVNC